nr:hypothetical protein [Tanacetum cinerariifolium]
MELCNGNGIGKIMSGIGKPMLMDRMTKDRCLKKAGKLDFARVLVKVSANEELPNVLEIAYPPIGNREAKVGKLEVRYQWKPPLCTHCKTFGHTFLACKLRPRTDVERAAKIVKDALILKGPLEVNYNAMKFDEEGFIQGNSSFGYGKYGNQQRYSYEKRVNPQNSNWGNVGSKGKSNHAVSSYVKKNVGPSPGMSKDKSIDGSSKGKQDLRQLSKDSSFKPKVLVRGSSLKTNSRVDCNDPIPTMNSFLVLVDDFMVGDENDIKKDKSCVEEFESIWPDLKSEVDILMEAGIYPSKSVRLDWTVNQMDYFYKNCHKYHLDPSYEDEDVESKYDGISMSMKPEFELDTAANMKNGADHASNSLRNSLWVILGDFNSTLDPSEKSSGCSKVTTAMSDFRDCVANIEVEDISMSGLNFTWNKSPGKVGGLLKKLDRIMGNVYFVTSFPTSYARFFPFMTSDHTPAIFVIPEVAKAKPKPFKFHNYLTGKDGFFPAVKKVWDSEIEGFSIKFVAILKKSLDEFGSVSGLFPSFPKSTVFFGNVKEISKNKILKVMPFIEGKLPVRKGLWIGRISRCHLLGDFSLFSQLWALCRGKARIKWVDVCKPKVEGGLEKEGSFWSWKKILRYRSILRSHIVHRIGNGLYTSLWFDNWHAICPLSDFISKRKIYYSGLSLDCKCDLR